MGRHLLAQDHADVAQQLVTGGVAAGVVDDLELVEVQVQHRVHRLALELVDRDAQAALELAPVRQPGQGVVGGLVADFLRQLVGLADIVALHEDAADLAGVVQDRLVDEVDVVLHRRTVGLRPQLHRHGAADEGLAGGVHAVEQFEEALALQFGQRVPHRLAEDVAVADQRVVGLVGQFEHVLRAPAHGHEARRLLHQVAQVAAFGHQGAVDAPGHGGLAQFLEVVLAVGGLSQAGVDEAGDIGHAVQDVRHAAVGAQDGGVGD